MQLPDQDLTDLTVYRHDDAILGARSSCPDTARSITRKLRNLPTVAPLRFRYIYNNMMYTVLTHLVEVKSGQSYGDFLHSNFFQPLGMKSTNLQPSRARSDDLGERMGMGHFWDRDASVYFGIPIQDCPESQGAGSIVSSANDLILWVKALLSHEGPITDKVYRGIIRMRSFRDPSPRKPKKWTSPGFYAAGLEIYYYRGYAVVFHDGSVSGFASRIFFVPELRFGACMIGNAGGAISVIAILVRELLDEVLQVPAGERLSQDKGKKAGKSGSKKKPANIAKVSEQTLPYVGPRPVAQQKPCESWPQPDADLVSYIGVYSHPGYHDMKVEIVDEGLFIDASDRSTGFTLSFEHIANQTKFTAHLCDVQEGGDDHMDAEFIMQNGRAIKLGLDLVPALKQLIWFERQDSKN
jgi:hypothetical protein